MRMNTQRDTAQQVGARRHDGGLRVATQDLTFAGDRSGRRNQWAPDTREVVWHRVREADHGLAACSWRIVLNDDYSPADAKWVDRLCRRCFPAMRGLADTLADTSKEEG